MEGRINGTENQTKFPTTFYITMEDSNWVMTSAFIIFTMQTGFGLLESGCVSSKNEVNIMMKNVVDIFLGGATYWLFGFGLQFGLGPFSGAFLGVGNFATDTDIEEESMGAIFTAFIFQLSFATTATTIVSGAMAESKPEYSAPMIFLWGIIKIVYTAHLLICIFKTCFKAYCIFSFLNTIVYCVPAGWVWRDNGFLNVLGAVDIAGSGCVHLIGGTSAFASAMMLGPRLGRYINGINPLPLGTPVNCVMGLFVLWWGWLAFNSGSTYGVSGSRWKYAAKAAVMTMLSSFGGGTVGLFYTAYINNGHLEIMDLINSVLAALVSVTGGCFLYTAWEAVLIGCIGGILCCATMPLFDKIGIDDPVGASSVHGICGIWGILAVGLFAKDPKPLPTTRGRNGLLRGGGLHLLGVQLLTCLCLIAWSFTSSVALLWMINKITPIRLEPLEELLGADLIVHRIKHPEPGVNHALKILLSLHPDIVDTKTLSIIGSNPGHDAFLRNYIQQHRDEKSAKNKISVLEDKNSFIPHYAWID